MAIKRLASRAGMDNLPYIPSLAVFDYIGLDIQIKRIILRHLGSYRCRRQATVPGKRYSGRWT
jgi:hypothetical protein